MTDARTLAVLTALLVGCAADPATDSKDSDTDADTAPTVAPKAPRDFELDADAQNVFRGNYIAGATELNLLFTDSLLYAVDDVDGYKFRSYAGTRDRDTSDFYPNGAPDNAPDTISLEARVTLPSAKVNPGTYDCKGNASPFSVSIRLFSKDVDTFVGFIASSILANEDDGDCTIEVLTADVDRFRARIPTATMRTIEVPVGKEGNTTSLAAKLEMVNIDFTLKEGTAPSSNSDFITPAGTDDETTEEP